MVGRPGGGTRERHQTGRTIDRVRFFAAPLGPDGKPDIAQAVDLEASWVQHQAVPGARYAPIPEFLKKRTGAAAAEKAMKEHAFRTLELKLAVHPGLGLAQRDGESPEVFQNRVLEAARLQGEVLERELRTKRASKLAKLQEKYESAKTAVDEADSALRAAPGDLSTILVGMVADKGTAKRMASQRTKASKWTKRVSLSATQRPNFVLPSPNSMPKSKGSNVPWSRSQRHADPGSNRETHGSRSRRTRHRLGRVLRLCVRHGSGTNQLEAPFGDTTLVVDRKDSYAWSSHSTTPACLGPDVARRRSVFAEEFLYSTASKPETMTRARRPKSS